MLSALAKYVINRLIHGLFHIALVISPRLISFLRLITRAYEKGHVLIYNYHQYHISSYPSRYETSDDVRLDLHGCLMFYWPNNGQQENTGTYICILIIKSYILLLFNLDVWDQLVDTMTGLLVEESSLTKIKLSWFGSMKKIIFVSFPCRKVETWSKYTPD